MEPQDVGARVPLDDVCIHVEGVPGDLVLLPPAVGEGERRHKALRTDRSRHDGRRHHLARQGSVPLHRHANGGSERRQGEKEAGEHERHASPHPAPLPHSRQRRHEQDEAQQGENGHDEHERLGHTTTLTCIANAEQISRGPEIA